MAVSALNCAQSFDSIHFGGVEARRKVRARSASFGARDRTKQPNEDSEDSGIGLRLVVRHTFLELEEGNSCGPVFEPTKSDGSDCDAASDSTAPSGKGLDASDFGSENGSVNSPVLRHSIRKWSDETASDSVSDCSEVDLLSCADDLDDVLDQADIKKVGPPGQHMPASPPGNFWPGWEVSPETQWPVECYDQAASVGPPGTFFQVCRSGCDPWGPCETSSIEPKQNDEASIGEEFDQVSQSIKSEGDEDGAACPSGGFWSEIVSSSDRWADMDDSITLTKDQTTVMLKNLPQSFTRTRLRSLLDSQGFAAKYDFVYVPTAFRSGQCFGYAFVNFIATDIAEEAIRKLHQFQNADSEDAKTMEVCYSHPNQGLVANVDRYRNSPVMHQEVPDEHRPMLLKNGAPLKFPSPTKQIHAPRVRRSVNNALETEDVACK